MKRTFARPASPSRSLAPGSSLSLDGPYCLPCVTRAHLSLPLHHHVITHAWTSPEKYFRDRECSFFLNIAPAHLCRIFFRTNFRTPHTHIHREKNTYVRTHTCEKKPSSRDRRPSRKDRQYNHRAGSSLIRFLREEMGKNTSETSSSFLSRIDATLVAFTYLQNHICCACSVGICVCLCVCVCVYCVCLKRLDSRRASRSRAISM